MKYFLVSAVLSSEKILFLFFLRLLVFLFKVRFRADIFASLQILDLRTHCTGLNMNMKGGCRVRVEKSCASWAGTIHIPTSLSRPGNLPAFGCIALASVS